MKIIDPGHIYHLVQLDVDPSKDPAPAQILIFVKREGEGYPGNDGHHHGTTTQEVVRALIDRIKYVDKQIPDPRNIIVLGNLRSVIYFLELRAAQRHDREEEFIKNVYMIADNFQNIEMMPVCIKCGHIGCEGACHD